MKTNIQALMGIISEEEKNYVRGAQALAGPLDRQPARADICLSQAIGSGVYHSGSAGHSIVDACKRKPIACSDSSIRPGGLSRAGNILQGAGRFQTSSGRIPKLVGPHPDVDRPVESTGRSIWDAVLELRISRRDSST